MDYLSRARSQDDNEEIMDSLDVSERLLAKR